jgi:hypothetical protein
MSEIISRPPKPSVDVQKNGMRRLGSRQAHFEELIGIRSVSNPLIGWRLRLGENIFGGHEGALSKRMRQMQDSGTSGNRRAPLGLNR